MVRVTMGYSLDMADAQRQTRLCSLQCLDLVFLIEAQYRRLVRRSQTEPAQLPQFLLELRIAGQLECARQMRVKSLAAQSLSTVVEEMPVALAMLRQLQPGSPMRARVSYSKIRRTVS